jgi:hypothetical protein
MKEITTVVKESGWLSGDSKIISGIKGKKAHPSSFFG